MSPALSTFESKLLPSSAVTVWISFPLGFVQVTVPPALTVTIGGWKCHCWGSPAGCVSMTDTAAAAVAAGVACGPAELAGVAVGRGTAAVAVGAVPLATTRPVLGADGCAAGRGVLADVPQATSARLHARAANVVALILASAVGSGLPFTILSQKEPLFRR